MNFQTVGSGAKLSGLQPPSESSDAWGLLEQFLSQLQKENELTSQLRLMLEMVHEATAADAVFICSLNSGQGVEIISPMPLPDSWARNLTAELLQRETTSNNELFTVNCRGISTHPVPASVILVQLSRSRKAWLGAVSLSSRSMLSVADLKLVRLARRMLIQQNQHVQTCEWLKETLFGLVRCLTASLDARDPYTWGHSERVARIGARLGEEMGLSKSELNDLYLGGLLHDIGKIGVPDHVLRKPEQLTTPERLLIEQHPVIGDEILSHVKQLAQVRPAVRSHHERWDGRGYPDHLSGTAVPLMARILAVADSCDAMMSDRPYRKGLPTEIIDDVLQKGSGTQWDPEIISHFFHCKDELYSIYQKGLGESVARAVENAIMMASAPTSDLMSSFRAQKPVVRGINGSISDLPQQ